MLTAHETLGEPMGAQGRPRVSMGRVAFWGCFAGVMMRFSSFESHVDVSFFQLDGKIVLVKLVNVA